MDNDDFQSPILGRRKLLYGAGALSLLTLARIGGAATREGGFASEIPDVDDLVDLEALQQMCVLTPSETAGPYYLNLNLLRQDIKESQTGILVRYSITVVDAGTCNPIPNATVDIWHNNALGVYSGYANQGTQGQTWLRGIQLTDSTGLAMFDSIYPGWYQGRTTHVHVKVRPTGLSELTTQMYFHPSLSKRIYGRPPYASHGQNPTTNLTDPLYLPETVMNVIGVTPGIGLQLGLTIGVA